MPHVSRPPDEHGSFWFGGSAADAADAIHSAASSAARNASTTGRTGRRRVGTGTPGMGKAVHTTRADGASPRSVGNRRLRACHDPRVSGDPYAVARAGADAIRERLGHHDVAVVLGSGWAGVVPLLGEERAQTPMPDLPGFPAPAVQGHTGMAHSLDVGGVPVLVMAGRSHLYEGHPASTVVHGVRSAVLSGLPGGAPHQRRRLPGARPTAPARRWCSATSST